MIQAFRKRSRIIVMAFVLAFPAAYGTAWVAGLPTAFMESLPSFVSLAGPDVRPLEGYEVRAGGAQFKVQAALNTQRPGTSVLRFLPELNAIFQTPEIVVYWARVIGDGAATTIERASLLGSLDSRKPTEFELPDQAFEGPIRLIFYSPSSWDMADASISLDFSTPETQAQ